MWKGSFSPLNSILYAGISKRPDVSSQSRFEKAYDEVMAAIVPRFVMTVAFASGEISEVTTISETTGADGGGGPPTV